MRQFITHTSNLYQNCSFLIGPVTARKAIINMIAVFTTGLFCLAYPYAASARSLYELTAVSEGEVVVKGFNDIEEFVDQLGNDGLRQLFPSYTDTSAALINLDIRGLAAITSYQDNSTVLNFQVPCSGTNINFTGATRDDSQDMLLDFLKGSGEEDVTGIYGCFVSDTPVDPVAGNPNSLVASMASDAFRVGMVTDAGRNNLATLGIGYEQSYADGFNTDIVSFIPINYVITFPNSEKPPYALIFDMPIRYINLEGADIIDGSIGIGVRWPVLNHWSLTPMFRFGGVGSINTGSFQGALLGSLTSKYDFYFDDLRLSINNMIAYSSTVGISSGDFNVNYDVQNGIFRNGISLEGSLNFKLFDQPTSWEFSFTDTRISGDSWYNNWWDEVNVSIGTRRRATRMVWQDLRFGAGYRFAKNYSSWQLTMNYRF